MRISDWSSDVCSSDLAEIEAGAADQDGQAARLMRLVDFGFGFGGPAGGGAGLCPVDMAEQAVRDAVHLLIGRPGGEDPEVGIDLAGVGVDDDAAGPVEIGSAECRERGWQYG